MNIGNESDETNVQHDYDMTLYTAPYQSMYKPINQTKTQQRKVYNKGKWGSTWL